MSEFVLGHHVVDGVEATRSIWLLHGVMGSARNWSSFARRLVETLPGWRAVTVDVRCHGDSRGAPPPHTVEACAVDLQRLAEKIGAPDAVSGHSFSGKVVLDYARRATPRTTFVLDCPPGPLAPGDATSTELGRVLEVLATVAGPIERRTDVADAFRAAGFADTLSNWMATNLRRREDDEGYDWSFDPECVRRLVDDYWRLDTWPILEDPPGEGTIHVVRAGRSDRWSADDLLRLDRLAATERVFVRVLHDAGHWLHADDPEGLLAVYRRALPEFGG